MLLEENTLSSAIDDGMVLEAHYASCLPSPLYVVLCCHCPYICMHISPLRVMDWLPLALAFDAVGSKACWFGGLYVSMCAKICNCLVQCVSCCVMCVLCAAIQECLTHIWIVRSGEYVSFPMEDCSCYDVYIPSDIDYLASYIILPQLGQKGIALKGPHRGLCHLILSNTVHMLRNGSADFKL